MKTRAAVAVAAGQPLEIMEVDLDGPRQGEVLVEIKATGICHTDEFTLSGADPEGMFPAILGHEGAGIAIVAAGGRFLFVTCLRWLRSTLLRFTTTTLKSRSVTFQLYAKASITVSTG